MIEKRMEQRGQGGFTLIELLVVIAILAVLGGAVIIGIGAMRENAEEQVCKTNKETIEVAAEAYKLDPDNNNAYPTDTGVLETERLIKPGSVKGTWTIDPDTGEATVTGGYDPDVMTACNGGGDDDD